MPAGDPSSPARELRSRRAVAAAIHAIERALERAPLRLAVAEALRAAGKLGPRERRHAAAAAHDVVQWLRTLEGALALARAPQCPLRADRALLLYLAWRVAVRGEGVEPALRDLALPGPRRPRTISDATLRDVARALPRPGPAGPASMLSSGEPVRVPRNPAVALGLRFSVPDFFAAKLLEQVGPEEAASCLAALVGERQLTVRVHAARASRGEVLEELRSAGVAADPGEDPLSVRIADRTGLFDSAPFRRGLVEVQDEGSQAVVAACAAAAGERWLDLCAGSGGKALALAARGARVTAWDKSPRRLADLPRRAARARLHVAVAAALPEDDFDGVLVDAPCSGSGALQRDPEARWRFEAPALQRLVAIQDEVLATGAGRVRAGGVLVYATCSLFREEGEERVRALLARGGFALDHERRRWPQREPGSGFYMARLRRTP